MIEFTIQVQVWLDQLSDSPQGRAIRAGIALRGKTSSDILDIEIGAETVPGEPDGQWETRKITGRQFYTITFTDQSQFYGIYDPEVYAWPA